MKDPKIAMIILAAGEGSRMGKIKQLLPWKNTHLLGYTIEQGLKSDVDAVFVVLGANRKLILDEIQDDDIHILNNIKWKDGMGTSLSFAMDYIIKNKLKFDAVLIALSDQPLIEYKYYNDLIYSYLNESKKIVSTIIKDRYGAPVLFDKYYFESLQKLSGERGAKALISKYINDVITIDSNHKNKDIDTLESYTELFNQFGKPSGIDKEK